MSARREQMTSNALFILVNGILYLCFKFCKVYFSCLDVFEKISYSFLVFIDKDSMCHLLHCRNEDVEINLAFLDIIENQSKHYLCFLSAILTKKR